MEFSADVNPHLYFCGTIVIHVRAFVGVCVCFGVSVLLELFPLLIIHLDKLCTEFFFFSERCQGVNKK